MGSQEEDVEDEPSQQMQQTPEEQDEHMSTEADAPGVDLKEMAKQVRSVLTWLFSKYTDSTLYAVDENPQTFADHASVRPMCVATRLRGLTLSAPRAGSWRTKQRRFRLGSTSCTACKKR
ncbi:unnamed protein product [Phytophthora lilii]|uniref:Unnamed protein product n=1 Tax=Phytophthora lilii TaxID=2077276 RepID=A0A9W6TEG3_9STRA|nr:unnamed protein product [Phytophthora lilii]